jgi:hypothetical protein
VMADVNTTHNDSPRDPRRRDRIAGNTYRRLTKSGKVVFEVVFRDVDGRQRTRRLQARTERAAIREARGVLAGRDGGQRVVPANVTIDDLANDEWFPLLDSLVGSGRRSERHTDDIKGRYRLHVEPRLGHMPLGDVEPRHIAALLRAMRSRKPRPNAEATIANVFNVIRALYRLARSHAATSRVRPSPGWTPPSCHDRDRRVSAACSTRPGSRPWSVTSDPGTEPS